MRGFLRGRKVRLGTAAFALFFVALNGVAYRQALSTTHFTPGGDRTKLPAALSLAQKVGVLVDGVRLPRPLNNRTPLDEGMPFETWTIPVEEGVTLEAWRVLDPEPHGVVVMFHGYADRKSSILAEARAFRDEGWDPVLVDLRGSGGSSGNTTSIGFHEARDEAAAVQFVRSAIPHAPLIVWGVSMGGAAALRAVGVLGSPVDGLIVEAPFATLRSAIVNRFRSLGLPSFGLVDLFVFWGGVQQGFNGFKHNPVDYAKGVVAPTLLLLGDKDLRVLMPEGRAIYDALSGAKRFESFAGLGHESLVRGNHAQWTKVIHDFLSRWERPATAQEKGTAS